jgi:hypothetical protein
MPHSDLDEPIWVTPKIIRQKFNQSQMAEKATSSRLKVILQKNSHPESPIPGEPYCTHSQLVLYKDYNGALVAIVHQYMRPDGTLGASGKPDPKYLYLEGKIYKVRFKQSGSKSKK